MVFPRGGSFFNVVIASIVAPGKDLTVVFGLRSLFLISFKMESPTSNVVWFMHFLSVRSIGSFSSFEIMFVLLL